MGEVDVAIVGAGAAGLAAWSALAGSPLSVLALEAGDRIGGRARTIAGPDGAPIDLGCGWLHSASRNPWTAIARARGFRVDDTPPRWGEQTEGEPMSEADAAAFERAYARFHENVERAARARVDRPASDLLEPGGRFNALLDAISTYANGVELDSLSTLDLAAYSASDTDENWRVREGYGALVADFGAGAPVVLGAPVAAIDHRGRRIALETPKGRVSARAVVVTVSTAVLARQAIRFDPPLPEKAVAAAGLPLGLADKLYLRLDEPEALDPNGHVLGRLDATRTGSYLIRPFGLPLIECFVGGRLARSLSKEGRRAFEAFALEELSGVLGSDARKTMRAVAASDWSAEPHVLGSYSAALPGQSGGRAALAAPVDDRIFFAGEATSRDDFGTAHGAYASGLAAGRAARAALERG